MTIEQTIWTALIQQGLPKIAVAGILGNLQAESSLKSNNLEDTRNATFGMSDELYTTSVDNGTYNVNRFISDSAGYGIAQWTSKDRKRNLYNICKGAGKSISDLTCQLNLLYKEIIDRGLLNPLKQSQTIREASDIFLFKFENPLDKSERVQIYRASLGEQFYNKLKDFNIGGTNKMKYTQSNPPLKCIMTNATCFKSTRQMNIKGVLIHSTGANNPNLKRYVQPSQNDANYQKLIELLGKNTANNDWNHIEIQAGLNAWIGKLANGNIASIQTMPWNYRPWGCGSGSAGTCNDGWIQYEICEDSTNDKAYFELVYKEACELTAYLCKTYNLNPKGTVNFNGKKVPIILCHQDSARLGLGSNHADVYHWFGKFGKDMNMFRNDVASLLNNSIEDQQTIITPTIINNQLLYTRLLKLGRQGNDVKELQEALEKLGYSVGKYGADGSFGDDTLAAVIKFQEDNGLDNDGEVGPLTIEKLNEKLSTSKKPKESNQKETTTSTVSSLYRIRKTWKDTNSQIGAFKSLDNAKIACEQAGKGYCVFDDTGKQVYAATGNVPITPSQNTNITPAKTYSDVMIGSASKDENGRYVGGLAGDQTGKEVWVLGWYDQNWTSILRPNDPQLAENIARQCENACANNKIGYSQSERNTLLTAAKQVGYDMSKISTPCNCDCSSFVSAICVCCGLPESIFFAGGNGRVTSNMSSACLATGKFTEYTDMKYRTQKNYLKRGDILLNRNQHVVIVLSNGRNA